MKTQISVLAIALLSAAIGYAFISNGSSGGAGTTTPMWAHYFGTGAESTGPANGSIAVGEHDYTTWTCTGAVTTPNNVSLVVRATGAVVLDTGCSITTGVNTGGLVGELGGAGGSGGTGAANSGASAASSGALGNISTSTTASNKAYSASAAASSGGIGNNGGVIPDALEAAAFSIGPSFRVSGGGAGTAGASTGGAGGGGRPAIIIIAPSITIASGVTLATYGNPGVQSAANSTGAGGGGGGGNIWLISKAFTNNGAILQYGGGPGGANHQPSIQAIKGGCDTTGCGTDALFTVTGLTTNGLDASKITITNAGTGYKTVPTCQVNAGTSGLVGSPACHFTLGTGGAAGTIASVVIDTAGSGGTLTTYTTSFAGGYGAAGRYHQFLMQ